MSKNTAPLRKFWYGGMRLSHFPPYPDGIPEEAEREWLDCGHLIVVPQDIYGRFYADRRRCWKCARQRPPDFDVAALAEALKEL